MRRVPLLLLAACAGRSPAPLDDTHAPADSTADTAPADTAPDTAPVDTVPTPLPWADDPCAVMDTAPQQFPTELARLQAQDDADPPAPGQVVLLGSSSIRRWESGFELLAPWGVVQRGLGGAHLSDVAQAADALALRHAPAALVVFAGTNDVAAGVPTDTVVAGYRCLVQRTFDTLGPTPVLFVSITPTPSRWALWPQQQAVNDAVAALAAQHPQLAYVDVATPMLATGSPPDLGLYDDDQLHLSPAGYALWDEVVRAAVADTLPERAAPTPTPLPAGANLRLDLGPANPEDGWLAPSPDAFGLTWNAWPDARGSEQVLAGEHRGHLRTTTGLDTDVGVVITGNFRSNGLRNGGLTSPPGDALQTLAVPEATADFFYAEAGDDPGALALTGLDPNATYTLRFFASRADPGERRVTRYVVRGATEASVELVTTGPGVGSAGGNDHDVAVLSGLAPSAWGHLVVDLQRAEGRYAYLSLLELSVEP